MITQLTREGSPPPGLLLPQAKLSRKSNQVARGRIRRFGSYMPSQTVRLSTLLRALIVPPPCASTVAACRLADRGPNDGARVRLGCGRWRAGSNRTTARSRRAKLGAGIRLTKVMARKPNQGEKLDRCAPTATPMPEFCRRDHIGFSSGPRIWL
jgi:hypothetical protein